MYYLYNRTTLDIDNFIEFCNSLLENPAFSQTQKKIICEGLEETLKSNNTDFRFNYIYWIEHGRRQWIDDGCPTGGGYPVVETEIATANMSVSSKYVGYEPYSRRYYA